MKNSRLVLIIVAAIIVIGGIAWYLLRPSEPTEVKLGILLGFTGPLEALAPPIGAGAELAYTHVNEQGGIVGGTITPVTGDSTCADATAAANAADRLINTDGVIGIMGAMCSGATISAANSAGIPAGVVMISPSATSPAVTDVDDNDLLFRTAPSDAYQGQMMSNLLMSKGIEDIAIAYVNNDYGKGFADSLEAAFTAAGGTVTANEAHEEGKSDYRAELGSLAASGSQNLVILAYAQGSGQTLLRQAIEGGNFNRFIGGDGMISDDLFTGFDAPAGMIGTKPGTPEIPGAAVYAELAEAAGLDPTAIFAPQAYDGAFLLALAIEAKGTADTAGMAESLRAVSSAPGEIILPGEWAKAKEILAGGGDVNYEGASGSHEFDENGDVPGTIIEMAVRNGSWVEVGEVM